jgi:hypothetical protein
MNALEHAVLELLVERSPALLSIDEVVRDMAPDPADFAERDDVKTAIRQLVQAGLAHHLDDFVFATVAANRFATLRDA